ncbi:MAG: hypothetical protein GZ091_06995 [Paludibacter sp.]|nr:hypothetical protein [Paludibacter sp.]
MKKLVLSMLLVFAIGMNTFSIQKANAIQLKSSDLTIKVNALTIKNDSLFAATSDGIWVSPSKLGNDWVAFGLQGKEVRLLNFKVKRLAIVATSGNYRPLYEYVGGAWVQFLSLPSSVSIFGGFNFEQIAYSAPNSLSIVIPTGIATSSTGVLYKSLDGGATFAAVTIGKSAMGIDAFDGDEKFYFPNSNQILYSPTMNMNQSSFYYSSNKGDTYARFALSYSIGAGTPANFIFKLASVTNPGHTYHFLGGMKDVVRVDSLGLTATGSVIPWNNLNNWKSFLTRTVSMTDGATNLSAYINNNFKKMMQAAGKLYLLADTAVYVSTNEGETYNQILAVKKDTVLSSFVVVGSMMKIGHTYGIKNLNLDGSTGISNQAETANIKVFATNDGINVSCEGKYSVTVYGVTGQMLTVVRNLEGKSIIPLKSKQNFLIVKVENKNFTKVVKLSNL